MKYKFIALIYCTFCLFSCEFEEPVFNGIENFKVDKFENNELFLNVSFKLLNENSFKIKVKPSKLDVFIEDTEMGQLFLDKKIVFKKKKEGIYSTILRIKLANGAMISAMKFMTKKELKVHLKGKVKGSVFGLSKKIPVDETKTVSTKDFNFKDFMK